MILRKKAIFIVFMLSVIFFINADSNSLENSNNFMPDKRFLLIIDFGFLSCPLCVQSLSEFIDVINSRALEKSIIGVLIFERERNESGFEKYINVMEKRLKGFIIGNDIKFPIILDRNGVFKNFSQNLTTLILFDNRNKIIKKYNFPLNKVEINEIFQIE